MDLTTSEKRQYSRHLILDEIGLKGQLRIKQAKVLVVGAGGLGCPVLQYLTGAGIGRIGVIDNDVVDQSNLQRQILYTHQDINKNKALTATNRLQEVNPHIRFDAHQTRLTKDNALDLFNAYDLIVDGTDNFSTRYLINDAAVIAKKPVVFGSIYKFEGQISVFNYNDGPTYRCLFPTPPRPNEIPNCSEAGVLGVLPGMIGVLQANEVLKIVCGIGEVLSGKLLAYNMLTMDQNILNFRKNTTLSITSLATNYELACDITTTSKGITLEELNTQAKRYNLLDVREAQDRELHHIGGQHIPLGELEYRVSEVILDKDLVVYCKSGVRSKKAIEILKEKGVTSELLYLKGTIL